MSIAQSGVDNWRMIETHVLTSREREANDAIGRDSRPRRGDPVEVMRGDAG